MPRHTATALLLAIVAVGCSDSGASETRSATPWPVTEFPALPEIMNDVPEARIELGRLLFFDPLLSADHETACVTCHSEHWGMGDGIPRAIGHGAGLNAGPRRVGPNNMRRNSPALFNMAFRPSLLWDGREQTLEEQALGPLFGDDELAVDEETLLAELSNIPEYVERFEEAFPDAPAISIDNLASALAAYQRTIISNRSSYDGYVEGRTELMSEVEIEGMFRFAEMGCDECHTPPMFESEIFADRNLPAIDDIVDYGREEHTGLEEDRGKFRTVSLRNLAATEPYFHDGSIKTPSAAIRHELEQSGKPFTEEDVDLITTFVDKSLRDETRAVVRPGEVPSGLPLPIDPAGHPSLD
jgi:cytochrome c peroxidase